MMVCKLISAIILKTLNYGTFALQSSRFRGTNKKIKFYFKKFVILISNHIAMNKCYLFILGRPWFKNFKVVLEHFEEKKCRDTIVKRKARIINIKSGIWCHATNYFIFCLNELSFYHKLNISNSYIFATWKCKPLIFQS